MARLFAPLIALALFLSATPARAESAEIAKARETYQAGVAAFSGGMFKDAEMAFRDVYDQIHTPEVLYDIALTLEKQRKWGPSADVYEAYLRDSKKVKDRKRISQRVADLRGRAQRQSELGDALNTGVTPKEVAATPGNEVMKLGDVEDNLMSFGEASGADDVAPSSGGEGSRDGATPIYKKWWLWAAVAAVVVVVAGVGIGVASSGGGAPAATTFMDIGPGAKGAWVLRF